MGHREEPRGAAGIRRAGYVDLRTTGRITTGRGPGRRLRVSAVVATDVSCTFTPEGAARRVAFGAHAADPVLGGARMAVQVGPDRLPAEAFAPQTVERIRALA